MCGICGIYRFDGQDVKQEDVTRMNQIMIHRGPDDEGYYINKTIGLGMRRLSIIDIAGGHQPISSEDGRYQIILNGEIYNYLELKKELIEKGHQFRTNTDTEVIVHLFEERGQDCVTELNGMFAFALWDNIQKELFIFRDRLGIKPLFYTSSPSSFIFCSDLLGIAALTKPVKQEININAFLSYIGLAYIPHPETVFKDVYKLEPGHFIKISANGKIIKKKYWDIREFETLNLSRIEDYQELILGLLRDSIRLQMRSDVSIGTFLSGGIDSSCVVALLSEQVKSPIKTFSVGFKRGINELPYAKLVSDKFHTDHSELLISDNDVPAILPEMIDTLDEPVSDNAIIPTLILSKKAIEKGVKVILNGTGGDEIFGGYERYLPKNRLKKVINSLPGNIRKLIGNLFAYFDNNKGLKIASQELEFMASISGINFSFAKQLFKNKLHYESLLSNIISKYKEYIPDNTKDGTHHLMFLDLKEYLAGDVLSLLDKMTMAVSLEGRVPLLDHRIVETCFRIPDRIKCKNGQLKGFFKDIMKNILPPEIFHLPKAGFSGPTHYWVNNSLRRSMYKHLVENPIPFYQEYLQKGAIKYALDTSNKHWFYSETLFSLYIFSLWYQKHVEGKEIVV